VRVILSVLFYWATAAGAGTLQITSTIYGADDRELVGPGTAGEILHQARSVAGLFKVDEVALVGQSMTLRAWPLGQAYQLCRKERFKDLPSAAECTGFLIAPNRITTAGHCLELKKPIACANMIWSFDYQEGGYNWDGRRLSLPAANAYRCKKILVQHNTKDLDFAIIELDRPVEDRQPVRLGSTAGLRPGDRLYALGFPQGVPMVWAASHEVVGLLIEGEMDLRKNKKLSCQESVPCPINGCEGEVFLSTEILKPFALIQ